MQTHVVPLAPNIPINAPVVHHQPMWLPHRGGLNLQTQAHRSARSTTEPAARTPNQSRRGFPIRRHSTSNQAAQIIARQTGPTRTAQTTASPATHPPTSGTPPTASGAAQTTPGQSQTTNPTSPPTPRMDVLTKSNPCACLVFMHHNEPSARITAQWMHAACRYNLAIVVPQSTIRHVNIRGNGSIDPNELFPRDVIEACFANDQACQDAERDAGTVRGAANIRRNTEMRFFLSLRRCSNNFNLPVVAIHNNATGDTANYRRRLGNASNPLDVSSISQGTFADNPAAVNRPDDSIDLRAMEQLENWVNQHNQFHDGSPPLHRGSNPPPTQRRGVYAAGQTNIFTWCRAADNTLCHIGDPQRPDDVVWTTNPQDFWQLRAANRNVVLQTHIDPTGNSSTDLSSAFIHLREILHAQQSPRLEAIAQSLGQPPATPLGDLITHLETRMANIAQIPLLEIPTELAVLTIAMTQLMGIVQERNRQRYINIETPQVHGRGAGADDRRVENFQRILATLQDVGLACCDGPSTPGQPSPMERAEAGIRSNTPPTTDE